MNTTNFRGDYRGSQIDPALGRLTYSLWLHGAKILQLEGRDTANARAIARPIARDMWWSCHFGFSKSELFRSVLSQGDDADITFSGGEDGSLYPGSVSQAALNSRLSHAIMNGIWTGCRTRFGPYSAAFETVADCPAGIINGVQVSTIPRGFSDHDIHNSAVSSGLLQRFVVLCPRTAENLN